MFYVYSILELLVMRNALTEAVEENSRNLMEKLREILPYPDYLIYYLSLTKREKDGEVLKRASKLGINIAHFLYTFLLTSETDFFLANEIENAKLLGGMLENKEEISAENYYRALADISAPFYEPVEPGAIMKDGVFLGLGRNLRAYETREGTFYLVIEEPVYLVKKDGKYVLLGRGTAMELDPEKAKLLAREMLRKRAEYALIAIFGEGRILLKIPESWVEEFILDPWAFIENKRGAIPGADEKWVLLTDYASYITKRLELLKKGNFEQILLEGISANYHELEQIGRALVEAYPLHYSLPPEIAGYFSDSKLYATEAVGSYEDYAKIVRKVAEVLWRKRVAMAGKLIYVAKV